LRDPGERGIFSAELTTQPVYSFPTGNIVRSVLEMNEVPPEDVPESSASETVEPLPSPDEDEIGNRLAAAVSRFVDGRKDPPDGDALFRFYASIIEEGDRALPIVCFSYLEAEMERLMRRAMMFSTYNDKLFNGFGPLNTTDARIEVAYALGWIDEEVRGDLVLLKRIRNDFAHNFIEAGLEDEKVAHRLSEHSGLKSWQPTDKMTGGTTRGLYLFAFLDTAWKLLGQLFVLPALRRLILADADKVMLMEGEYRPRVLHDLDDATGRMMFLLTYTHGDDEIRKSAVEIVREAGEDMGIELPAGEDWNQADLLKMMKAYGLGGEQQVGEVPPTP
jgi:hypothetical protein